MTTAKALMRLNSIGGNLEMRQQTITEVDDQCSAPDYDSQALPTASVGSVVATQSTAGTGEGISMSDRPFFKIWAAKALLSDDLYSLSDHERTIWMFALCVASLETPRWRVRITAHLARKCKTTPPKLAVALNKLAGLGMCELRDGEVYFATAAKLNEDTERRKPSDDPARVRERVKASRDRKRSEPPDVTPGNTHDVTPVTRYSNAHKEEEKEKEEEEEQGRYTPSPDDGLPQPIREMRDWILSRLSVKYRNDSEMWEACESFARTYQGQTEPLTRAYDRCIAAGEWPGPRNLAKYMTARPEPAKPRELSPVFNVPAAEDPNVVAMAQRRREKRGAP